MASTRVKAQISLGARPISDHDLMRANRAALDQVKLGDRRAIFLCTSCATSQH